MFRYVALMWNPASVEFCTLARDMERRLRDKSPNWSVELFGHGIKVLVADKSPAFGAHSLYGEAGLVLGEIFVRHMDIESELASNHAVFGERETREVLRSQGRALTSRYWGNYVGFVVDVRAGETFVVNDPAGSLPCYFIDYCGIRVLFSCLGDCSEWGLKRFHINWQFVRMRVLNGLYEVETNPIAEISVVHRGEGVRFDLAGAVISRSFYWHPTSFTDAPQLIDDADVARRALRSVVRSCVHSLAAHHSNVLQETSGGLDSSIVLGCLSEAPLAPEVTCYTGYVPDSACDERRWARFATERTRYRHVELRCDPRDLILEDMPALAPSVEPPSCVSHWLKGPAERRLAAQYGATATFTGEGGDAVFCSTCYILAVDHSIRRHGLGARTFRTAVLVAMRRDQTLWGVLGNAVRRRLFGSKMVDHRQRLSSALRLVHSNVRDSVRTQDHFPNPWFSSRDGMPLEMVARLGSLAFAPTFYDLSTSRHGEAPYTVSPLCAQPVFEVCQRIPVDIHFDGGRSRGLARGAFEAEVPEPILRRQWKDRPLLQPAAIIQRNLPFIREALLDGELTKERILDRSAIELALRDGPGKSGALSSEIFSHLDLALWIRGSL